jgi:hypothetical protein
MIGELIPFWNSNKKRLEQYFATTPQVCYHNYKDIVIKLFELVINSSAHKENGFFNTDKMVMQERGERYEGVLFFLIPLSRKGDYINVQLLTSVAYGSSTYSDTILGIHDLDEGLPTPEQVKQYMTLALHFIQKMEWLIREACPKCGGNRFTGYRANRIESHATILDVMMCHDCNYILEDL